MTRNSIQPDIKSLDPQWYQKWFDSNYILLYRHRNLDDARKQTGLILNTIPIGKSDVILDLGCGTGRYCHLFQEEGFTIIGLDLSESLLKYGRKQFPDSMLVRGDMRRIPGKFDVILSLFTSFGYFPEKKEDQRALNEISNSLKPGGYYWLDYLNPTFIRKHLIPESTISLENGTNIIEKRFIVEDFVVKTIDFYYLDTRKQYLERVRLYEKDELMDMLKEAGIAIKGVFGDYNGNQWNSESERTIIYGTRM
ncbi:MAG: class I SAM-dependent methyltransferase [Calditrichia bacterium]